VRVLGKLFRRLFLTRLVALHDAGRLAFFGTLAHFAERRAFLEVTADLLGQNGRATESIPYANIVSFTSLKAFAFDNRRENKDAHDLVYCLEHGDGGLDGSIAKFREALAGKHGETVHAALAILLKRFCDPKPDEGHFREGPVAAARFEIDGDDQDSEVREQRALRQRAVNNVISQLLGALGSGDKWNS
jgi:hypothetical protein